MKTIFQKIIDRELPADIILENEYIIVIRDIQPLAPHHYLLVPKQPIKNIQDMQPEDMQLMQYVVEGVQAVAIQQGLAADGYRVITNNGQWGGQTIDHLHFHIIGGRQLTWEC